MGAFFVYILKASVCLAAFYLFYRMLLSKETFHRFNRFALLGIVALSFLIPSIRMGNWVAPGLQTVWVELEGLMASEMVEPAEQKLSAAWWVLAVYLLGILSFWAKHLWAMSSLFRLIGKAHCERQEDGTLLAVHNSELAPFSWMHYIVISKEDLRENGAVILAHEKAHIRNRHSWDLIAADLCISLQWFNPAAWLVKQELQNVHEYEADERVLDAGIDAKSYQLLLIKKAVGTRLYSMTNSFNHSTLKKRITMMIKRKSNPWARMKYVYVLPLAAIAVAAFARPEVSSRLDEISSVKVSDLSETMKQVSHQNASVQVPQEPVEPEVTYDKVEEMPEYPGGIRELLKFVKDNVKYPAEAIEKDIQGKVILQFVIEKDGNASSFKVLRSIHPLLDAEALRVVKLMPKWTPGKVKGEAVRVRYTMPVAFSIPKPEPKEPEAK